MAYKKTLWLDHVVQRPKTYTITDNSDGSKTLTDAPGAIVQQGTPMSATNFNNAEVGLLHSSVAFDMLYTIAQAQQRALESRIETLEAQIAALTATAET